MSFCAIKWSYVSPEVLKSGLGKSDLAVLRALCFLFNDKGGTRNGKNCYPSVECLAKMTGLRKSAVNMAKSKLFKKGLISWDRGANFDAEHQSTNVYRIACPALEKILKANEDRLRRAEQSSAVPVDDPLEDLSDPIVRPGFLFNRPDPASLVRAFDRSLSADESAWMADALSFVCDRPGNRKSLYAALRRSSGLASCRAALNRVISTSRRGRVIANRVVYLVTALRNGEAHHSK